MVKATTARTQPHSSYALDSISNVLSPNYQSYNVEEDGRQSMVTFKSAFVMKTTPANANSNFDDDGLLAHTNSVFMITIDILIILIIAYFSPIFS